MDLLLKNCRLREFDYQLRDVAIEEGKIAAVEEDIKGDAEEVIDLKGKLVSPAFIEPHIHLDKIFIVDVVRPNKSGTLKEAIEIIWDKKRNYTEEDIVKRAGDAIKLAALNGTTRMRSHVDIDTIGGLLPLKGVVSAREQYRNLMDIELVAFPQEGIVQDPGTEKLMCQAMEEGADIVGGMPANEKSPEDSLRHVEIAFEIAREYDADIDMHVDETDDPFYRTLEMVADLTMKYGWEGRVTAGHTVALAAYDDHYAEYVMDKVKAAGIHVITNPATNLMLQGRLDSQPIRRGITRVKELLARGINVGFGQDCVKDTFYPFGRCDLMEVALVTAHAAHLSLPEEIETVFDMPTYHAARIMRLSDYGMGVGDRADLVVLDAESAADAIRLQPARLYVIKEGRIVATSKRESELYL
ncbi:MAG: amidohydrolase family protein [Halanaerobium sp.]|nr:amidohydrolase family protein [Halanaerobium sp.]